MLEPSHGTIILQVLHRHCWLMWEVVLTLTLLLEWSIFGVGGRHFLDMDSGL